MTTTETQFRALGMSNDVTECDNCGRMELRGTVIIVNSDGEEVGRYGTTCASRILGRKITRQDALNTEAYRRSMIKDELRRAFQTSKSGDVAATRMYLDGARKIGAVREDEKAMIEKLTEAVR